jgi:deoxyribose-phosphate aldolase
MDITRQQLAKALDHSLVFPAVTDEEVRRGCEIARRCDVATVTVKPCQIELALPLMHGSNVLVGSVAGFPQGQQVTRIKALEAEDCLRRGAQEIDMVINIGKLLSGQYDYVREDVAAVKRAAGAGVIVKVILEICYLTKEQIVRACHLVEEAGADFVKTATGFAASGATPLAVRLMRRSVGPRVQVKAAHGIRDYVTAMAMLDAGATRLGVRTTEAILQGWDQIHGTGTVGPAPVKDRTQGEY